MYENPSIGRNVPKLERTENAALIWLARKKIEETRFDNTPLFPIGGHIFRSKTKKILTKTDIVGGRMKGKCLILRLLLLGSPPNC